MVIKTRFRDVPVEEITCRGVNCTEAYWNKTRGKPVMIETPAVKRAAVDTTSCDGPFYLIYPPMFDNGSRVTACPHAIEVGD